MASNELYINKATLNTKDLSDTIDTNPNYNIHDNTNTGYRQIIKTNEYDSDSDSNDDDDDDDKNKEKISSYYESSKELNKFLESPNLNDDKQVKKTTNKKVNSNTNNGQKKSSSSSSFKPHNKQGNLSNKRLTYETYYLQYPQQLSSEALPRQPSQSCQQKRQQINHDQCTLKKLKTSHDYHHHHHHHQTPYKEKRQNNQDDQYISKRLKTSHDCNPRTCDHVSQQFVSCGNEKQQHYQNSLRECQHTLTQLRIPKYPAEIQCEIQDTLKQNVSTDPQYQIPKNPQFPIGLVHLSKQQQLPLPLIQQSSFQLGDGLKCQVYYYGPHILISQNKAPFHSSSNSENPIKGILDHLKCGGNVDIGHLKENIKNIIIISPKNIPHLYAIPSDVIDKIKSFNSNNYDEYTNYNEKIDIIYNFIKSAKTKV
uniref:Uncharacterized protein n=1 Tax=Metapenaeus ensis majanivirus TaxID=2984279 RepID=A0A9C7C6D5_9VIRU|nr:MAG: hypothetical protein [Metapenaeus ensis majanivirus]